MDTQFKSDDQGSTILHFVCQLMDIWIIILCTYYQYSCHENLYVGFSVAAYFCSFGYPRIDTLTWSPKRHRG